MSAGKWLLLGTAAALVLLGVFDPALLRVVIDEVMNAIARVILEILNAAARVGLLESVGIVLVLWLAWKFFRPSKKKS